MSLPVPVVCAQLNAASPLQPGYLGGYQCFLCERALQMGAHGRARLEQYDGRPFCFCNECGRMLVARLNQIRPGMARIELGPDAMAQLATRGRKN